MRFRLPAAIHLVRFLLGVIALIGVVRAGAYFVYVFQRFGYRWENAPLEAKMVHLAWRVQAGLTLYPDWRNDPYVSNFYGPIYFLVVGGIGRAVGSTFDGLFIIGRLVTLLSTLTTTLILGLVIRSRFGTVAGWLGAIFSLGSRPLFGYSLMVRPDLMAETFGVAGFFLATSDKPYRRTGGVGLLALAALTKQTAAVFLIAAVAARLVSGQSRQALTVAAATLALLALCVAPAAWWFEPNLVASLLGDAGTPWMLDDWGHQIQRFFFVMPDLFFVPAFAVLLWVFRRPRQPALTVLTVVLIVVSAITVAKRGADVNYFLNLRICEAVAFGALWHTAQRPEFASFGRLALPAAGFALITLIPGTTHAVGEVHVANVLLAIDRSEAGQEGFKSYTMARKIAETPKVKILTDVSLIDVYQRERTAFGDPFLFRLQVETGAIKPTKIVEKIESRTYSTIITRNDLFSKDYETYDSALPMVLVEPVRRLYVPTLVLGSLYYYTPRETPR